MENPGALIIDGHGRADLGVVRALGESGIPVYLLTDNKRSPVAGSRFVHSIMDFPSRNASDEEKVRRLQEIGKRFAHRPVFFSTGDTSLMLFSRHRDVLEQYFLHHIGDAAVIEACNDKRQFARLAREKNLAVPYSLVPGSLEELQAEMSNLSFPVMVKPSEKRNWDRHPEIYGIVKGNLKGMKVSSPDELVKLYQDLSVFDGDMVIQNYIEGRDEAIYSLHTYIDKEGDVTGWFVGQKIRTYPIHRGIGCFQLSVIDEQVRDLGISTLKAIGYTGHAIVQVKMLPDTGEFQIFEINCRYSTWAYLHKMAGVNLELVAYQDSLGAKPARLPVQHEGARWIDAGNDVKAFLAYYKIGEWSLLAWLRTYVGRNCYAIFAWNDPRPWIKFKFNRVLSRL